MAVKKKSTRTYRGKGKGQSHQQKAYVRNLEKARISQIGADIEFDNFVSNRFGVPAGEHGKVRKIKKGGKLKKPNAAERSKEAGKSKKAYDRDMKAVGKYKTRAKRAQGGENKRAARKASRAKKK